MSLVFKQRIWAGKEEKYRDHVDDFSTLKVNEITAIGCLEKSVG